MDIFKIFIVLYMLYVVIKISLSLMQIGFINREKNRPAKILGELSWGRAADYAVTKEKLSIIGTIVELIIAYFWVFYGLDRLDLMIENSAIKAVVFVNIFLFINYLIDLPLSIYSKFVVDEQFGFNKSTKSDYFKDEIKTISLTFIFGSIVIYLLSLFIDNFEKWWIISAIFLIVVVILLNILFPIIRAKMFDKFTSLEGSDLGDKIVDLMKQTGFKSSGVYSVDASKRDARLNAYFAGIGATKRVVLFDTLIEKLSEKELLAVLGHELGHFKHGDLYKNIVILSLLLFGMLAIFGNLPISFFEAVGVEKSSHILMVLFLIFSTPLMFFIMPIFNAISRHNEFEADRFGGELVDRVALKDALIKLVIENVKFPLSHPLYALFYETHPNVLSRVERLEN